MKKLLVIFIVAISALVALYVLYRFGIISFETAAGSAGGNPEVLLSADDLESDRFYVWHDSEHALEEDLAGTSDPGVFTACPEGTVSWGKNKRAGHAVWFSTSEEHQIPTLYPGDELVYVSLTSVPGASSSAVENGNIKWERFADYGYSIGVANLAADKSGHYYIEYDSDAGYAGFINDLTDAKDVAEFQNFAGSRIYLDKVGDADIREGLVSDGGTILGLKKDVGYLCKWYKGSYVSDFKLTAEVHAFGSMESFTTTGWEFVANKSSLRSCITITIPEELKTGYYCISDAGFFRYVGADDVALYDGSPYDPNVDWNDPIILRDDNGQAIYDPFLGIDERERTGSGAEQGSGGKAGNSGNGRKRENHTPNVEAADNADNLPDEDQVDAGAEEYEDFGSEAYSENSDD